ncbi:uncharacterized protein LOC124315687 [Daphnia pulicaria]|uniref:uncharacterized protein LOC124315687 n=1 Tax=Daphnia pulicaria TaxID=35523 RepID=UPI001EEB2B8F|nr:uncharacterized protein LOC124315687 [Daphnia pulicaria]
MLYNRTTHCSSMQILTLALFFGTIAATSACANMAMPGKTSYAIAMSIMTTEDDEMGSGLLSTQERAIIRTTWNKAKKDGDVAPKLLSKFLKAYPEYQKKFSKFSDVPQSDLLSNGNFLAQSYTILAGLNVIVQSLSSQELMANQLNALGGAHQPRGVTTTMFKEFGVILIQVLEEEIGSAMTIDARQAWKNGIHELIGGLSQTLKNPEDLPDPQTRLTPQQIKEVQSTWASMRGDRNSIVSAIFIELFRENPRSQKYFAKFASLPLESLISNTDFNQQVALVANRLDTIISAMGDKLQLLGNINYMRYSHEQRIYSPRNAVRDRFEDFGRLLLDTLIAKGIAGDDLDSWKSVLKIFIDGIAPEQ